MASGASSVESSAENDSRRVIFIAVGGLTALLLAGMFYFMTRPATTTNAAPQLEGAIRQGEPAFEAVRNQIVLDSKEAFESPRAVGDIVMTLQGTVRNFTGRTITGLEVRGAVVDTAKNVVKERTIIVPPAAQTSATALETNKTMPVRLMLEGFKKSDDRADTQLEIVGVRFK